MEVGRHPSTPLPGEVTAILPRGRLARAVVRCGRFAEAHVVTGHRRRTCHRARTGRARLRAHLETIPTEQLAHHRRALVVHRARVIDRVGTRGSRGSIDGLSAVIAACGREHEEQREFTHASIIADGSDAVITRVSQMKQVDVTPAATVLLRFGA